VRRITTTQRQQPTPICPCGCKVDATQEHIIKVATIDANIMSLNLWTVMVCDLYCGKLTVRSNLKVTGSITASHKVFGADKNQGELHHHGSIFYILWSSVHQVSSLSTTDTSTTVTWATTAAHGLDHGDTVHISSLPNNPGPITEVNGVPASELVGTHVIIAVPSATTFSITVTTAATSTGNSTDPVPIVRIDRYRHTDMNDSTVSWLNSTTLPTPAHTNVESCYA